MAIIGNINPTFSDKPTFQTARSDRIRVVVEVVMMRRRTTDEDDGPVMIYGDAGGDGDGLLSPAKLKSKQIQRSAESIWIILNLSSGCVENSRESKESSTWHFLRQR